MSPPEAALPAAERRKGYGRWSGERTAQTTRWLVVARANLALILSNRWVKVLLFVSVLPGVGVAVVTYFFLPLSAAALDGAVDASAFFVFLLAAIAGSRLVAEDRRQGAFLAHFSRPVTRFDYVAGKTVALSAVLFVAAAASGLLAVAADAGVDAETLAERFGDPEFQDPQGFLKPVDHGAATLAVLGWAALVSVATSGIVLGLSAATTRTRIAAVAWIGLVTVGEAVRGILLGLTDLKWGALLSWLDTTMDLSSFMLQVRQDGLEYDPSTRVALLVLAAAVGFVYVVRQVGASEEAGR